MVMARLIATLCLAVVVNLPAYATTVSFTGAELFDDPNVSFPNAVPTVLGDSLVFGPNQISSHDKLLVLPISDAGAAPTLVSVEINLTRIACVGECADSDPGDFDPHILLGDGERLIGALIGNDQGGLFAGASLNDAGASGDDRIFSTVFDTAGYPAIGTSFDIVVDFLIEDSLTTVTTSFLSGTGSFRSDQIIQRIAALDPSAPLEFVFMRDNDPGESYQINFLRIHTDLPQPVALDIKPGSDPNCFNQNGHGVIPVAILSNADFDVAEIDISTLSFGGLEVRVRGNSDPMCSLTDVNDDGDWDLVCQFEDDSDLWTPGEGEATLSGNLMGGSAFEGTDSICIVPQ